jgi:hypothetical protein
MLGRFRGFVVIGLVAGALAASASPAGAVTVGQLAPGSPPPTFCTNGPNDSLNPTVTSGNSYVIPTLTAPYGMSVTSWSTNAAAGDGQMLTFKVFRKVGDPDRYEAVGHDGPHPLDPGQLNSFATSIPVQAGDIIGLNDENAIAVPNACNFTVSGESALYINDSLADGDSGDFLFYGDARQNITAEVSANAAPPPPPAAAPPTGQRAAALKRCKKKAHKRHWSKKQRKKCRKKAKKLPL